MSYSIAMAFFLFVLFAVLSTVLARPTYYKNDCLLSLRADYQSIERSILASIFNMVAIILMAMVNIALMLGAIQFKTNNIFALEILLQSVKIVLSNAPFIIWIIQEKLALKYKTVALTLDELLLLSLIANICMLYFAIKSNVTNDIIAYLIMSPIGWTITKKLIERQHSKQKKEEIDKPIVSSSVLLAIFIFVAASLVYCSTLPNIIIFAIMLGTIVGVILQYKGILIVH